MCVITEHTEYSLQPNPTSHRGSERRECEESPPSERSRAGSLRGRKGLGCDTTRRARGPTAGLGTILTSERLKPAFRAVFPRLLAPSAPNLQRWRGWVPLPAPAGPRQTGRLRAGPGRRVGPYSRSPGLRPRSGSPPLPRLGAAELVAPRELSGSQAWAHRALGVLALLPKQLLFPN